MQRFKPTIDRVRTSLVNVPPKEKWKADRELKAILRKISTGTPGSSIQTKLAALEKRLASAVRKREQRLWNVPRPSYPADLPITAKKDDIVAAIRHHPVVIVSGETGSGKTTQIPKFCLEAGRGVDGIIGCTQPRRIAATTVAGRIAEELGEDIGNAVGYKIRFKDRTGRDGYIKIMTDGILLAEAQIDPYLNAYDTIIVDEAHERSLNVDFIVGILKTLLSRRKDLRVIITSATIDTEKFSAAFDNAPVIEVSGRLYPVEIVYAADEPPSEDYGGETYVDAAVRAVDSLQRRAGSGDILIFMPTEQDIRETCELIEGRYDRDVTVLPLFARLPASEQGRVFRPAGRRKIIVATNVAETSITIPGIKYVIDTGLARISRYSPRSRITSLPITPISKSSADQRKGRCGRVENGVCIRLFDEPDYENRPLYTPPEILRTNLAEVILRMTAMNLGHITDFPFIDKPQDKSISDGFNLLIELGAIQKKRKKKGVGSLHRPYALTKRGRLMAGLPIDPRLSRILIEARTHGCIDEITVIVSALSIRDPRERPAEKAKEADAAHSRFTDAESDFVTLLNIWHRFHDVFAKGKTWGSVKRYCKAHFLSFVRMREWRDIHFQIKGILKESGMWPAKRISNLKFEISNPLPEQGYAAIHKSILSGFLSNIALKKENHLYTAAKGKEVMIFPGSAIFKTAGRWIVAAEMVETSRRFARTAANIDSDWLESLGGDLCKTTYGHPHWERSRGQVVANAQITLFGLVIVPRRTVSYGMVDAAKASDVFIQEALVEEDVRQPLPFMVHNRKCIDDVRDMENRVRKRDILIDTADLFAFYRKRLDNIYDWRSLKTLIKQKGSDSFLHMKSEDLCRYRPEETELAMYPDRVSLGDHRFSCLYNFDPGKSDDGLTIRIPQSQSSTVPADAIDWLVPGLYRDKITALIKGLPKSVRKQLVPLADTVDIIVGEMPKKQTSMINALGRFIHSRFGLDIPASAWPETELPDHLRARIAITNPRGKEIRSGRDKAVLHQGASKAFNAPELDGAKKRWEKTGRTDWDFGDLPESIDLQLKGGRRMRVFPALEKDEKTGGTVNVRLFQDKEKATASHQEGVAALFAIRFQKELKFLKKSLALPPEWRKVAADFGGSRPFQDRLYKKILHDLFHENIRSPESFEARAAKVGPVMMSKGRDLLNRCLPVLAAYDQTRAAIARMEAEQAKNRGALEHLDLLRDALAKLVPAHFVDLYDPDRLDHLPRYVRAIAIRAQRAMVDPEKDRIKAAHLKIFTDSLKTILATLTPAVSAEKRQAVEDYFWMIEEYKVSLFAQELKTAIPISRKRLEKKLNEVNRLA